jgi:hypothetical protein
MAVNKILWLVLSVIIFSSCGKKSLVDKAADQMKVTIDSLVVERYGDATDLVVSEVKTVYANDSICLLQCVVNMKDVEGKSQKLEYRYIYLIDMFMSRLSGKAVYNEALQDFPCMPDSLIRKSQQDVVEKGESVYDDLFGYTFPVHPHK